MSHKLLLADDSVTIQRVIELTFADEDVQVLTAGDGEQAIATIRRDRPDIILADVGMPKRTGYDVAAFVKGEPDLSHIPVLLLTGAFEPVDEERAQAAGCDGVLVKPFEPQHVIARVRELLDGARAPGASVARAVADVPRAVERLTPSRPQQARAVGHNDPGGPTQRGARSPNDLDDYFDRLDAAFASIATTGDTPPSTSPEASRHEGPVMERDLDWFDSPQAAATPAAPPDREQRAVEDHGSASPSPAPPEPVPVTFANPPSVARSSVASDGQKPPAPPVAPAYAAESTPIEPGAAIADAFSALLAVEQGEVDPGAVRLALPVAPAAAPVTDELVEAVTRRVAERLSSQALQDTIADLVSRVAERLVREEIERIRSKHS